MYKAKQAISDFNRYYADKKEAKRVMHTIKQNIIYHNYDSRCLKLGVWIIGHRI